MIKRIDLNADLGEGFGPWVIGDDEAMLRIVDSANVACGGHAGDPETMYRALAVAADEGVSVGAHPGYVDPSGFGRRVIPMSHGQITRMVAAQIGALIAVASLVPVEVRYVKAHGALANLAARDAQVAKALADAVHCVDPALAVLAISGTEMERVARSHGLTTYSEIFADRGYQPDGQLVPRGQPGAMIHDTGQAADRLIRYLETGAMPTVAGPEIELDAHSICVHGDSPGAVAMAQGIRSRLSDAGVTFAPFASA